MSKLLLFFAGAFLANSIPHYVNGISGKEFVRPFLYKFVNWMPNPLFNVIWGMLWMVLSLFLFKLYYKSNPSLLFNIGLNLDFAIYASGFIIVSIFLSIFFSKGGWEKN
ncbi:MAG: hypothetical protein ACM31E_06625 [Fibrobacterota bacterium]|nr:hypothetical protein [Chitinispirillaceae bacterium]